MRAFARRCIGYGLAVPVAAGLCYAGFVWQPADDPEFAMTQAEIKLLFAAKLPPKRPDGSVVQEREAMIADAVRFIDEAERLASPTARTAEFRAYVEFLRGNAQAAAAGYARAVALATEPEERGDLVLSEARMRAIAGDDEGALALLAEHAGELLPATALAARLERARILIRLGRQAEGVAELDAVVATEGVAGEALLAAGQVFEQLGADASALAAYQRAASSVPFANYFAARLKARAGDVDNALGMLERAMTDAAPRVRSLVESEPQVWASCAATERFRKLFPEMEAARPGR